MHRFFPAPSMVADNVSDMIVTDNDTFVTRPTWQDGSKGNNIVFPLVTFSVDGQDRPPHSAFLTL